MNHVRLLSYSWYSWRNLLYGSNRISLELVEKFATSSFVILPLVPSNFGCFRIKDDVMNIMNRRKLYTSTKHQNKQTNKQTNDNLSKDSNKKIKTILKRKGSKSSKQNWKYNSVTRLRTERFGKKWYPHFDKQREIRKLIQGSLRLINFSPKIITDQGTTDHLEIKFSTMKYFELGIWWVFHKFS